jgi:integrase
VYDKILDYFGRKTAVDSLDTEKIVAWRNSLSERFSLARVNFYMTCLAQLMNFCVRRDYLVKSPSVGLSIRRDRLPREDWNRFSFQDIQAILHDLQLHKTKWLQKKPAWFFVPLLGMYTGCRIEEICQLHVSDVLVHRMVTGEEKSYFYYISINIKADKNTKTPQSVRHVPLHPEIIRTGFIEFVECVKQKKHERVFHELKMGENGFSHSFGGKWNRRVKTLLTDTEKKSFKSFRKAFSDELKQSGVEMPLISELMGHEISGTTGRVYTNLYDLPTRYKAILKLDYLSERARIAEQPASLVNVWQD